MFPQSDQNSTWVYSEQDKKNEWKINSMTQLGAVLGHHKKLGVVAY